MKFNQKQKDIIIDCGALNFTPQEIALLLEIPIDKVNTLLQDKQSDFYKWIEKGRITARYVLLKKLFTMAQEGDLKALAEFEERIERD